MLSTQRCDLEKNYFVCFGDIVTTIYFMDGTKNTLGNK
jgi:hypothetical protein